MRKLRYLFLLPLTAIVSCGYSTSYLVEGDKYVSAVFKENYYTHWDNELKNARKELPIDITSEAYIHNYSYSMSSTLEGFSVIDLNYFDHDPNVIEYGNEYKMNSVDDSFNYGYQSKLFDGQMICGAQSTPVREEYAYQKGRVQIPESGFSVRFSKESNELHYFAMQFKASTDNTREYYLIGGDEYKRQSDALLFHDSSIKFTITLFTKVNYEIVGYPFEIEVELDYKFTNDGHKYVFLAFDLEKYKTDDFAFSRLVGVSITYKVLSDALIDYNKDVKGVEDISYDDYALFLYEMFVPYTIWN